MITETPLYDNVFAQAAGEPRTAENQHRMKILPAMTPARGKGKPSGMLFVDWVYLDGLYIGETVLQMGYNNEDYVNNNFRIIQEFTPHTRNASLKHRFRPADMPGVLQKIIDGKWLRADGDCLCPRCTMPYKKHMVIDGFEWLVITCDFSLYKL